MLSELDALRHLDVLDKANASLIQQVQRLFGDYIVQVEDLDLAVALYQETVKFGQLNLVREQLLVRLRNEVSALEEDTINTRWLRAATHRLALIDQLFPDDQELNRVRTELANRVQAELPTLLASHTAVASDAWDLVENAVAVAVAVAVADEDERLAAGTEVQKAPDASQARQAQAAFDRARQQARTDVESLINVSCLRLDVEAIGQYLVGVLDAHRPAATVVAMERFRVCEGRLQALDENGAARLTAEIETFLNQTTPRRTRQDPCSGSYLLGNGEHNDRSGYCTDQFVLDAGDSYRGPKLVVVPLHDAAGKFAISKYETSWRDLNEFCLTSGVCSSERTDDLPATDLPIAAMEAYAQWLGQKTGFAYRLPTLDEWQVLAVGEPDPNRNSVIEAGGVRRGSTPHAVDQGSSNPFGLVHLYGNVREVVRAAFGYAVVGGGFNDPIEQCNVHALEAVSTADTQTGFRLVREISRSLRTSVKKLTNFSADVTRLRRIAKACAAGEISRSEYRRNRRCVIEVYTGGESGGDATVPRFDGDTTVRRDFDFVHTQKQSNGRTSLVWLTVLLLLVGALLAPTFVWAAQTIPAVQARQANPNLSQRFFVEAVSWQVPDNSELERLEVNELLARSLARIRASYQPAEHGFTDNELQ